MELLSNGQHKVSPAMTTTNGNLEENNINDHHDDNHEAEEPHKEEEEEEEEAPAYPTTIKTAKRYAHAHAHAHVEILSLQQDHHVSQSQILNCNDEIGNHHPRFQNHEFINNNNSKRQEPEELEERFSEPFKIEEEEQRRRSQESDNKVSGSLSSDSTTEEEDNHNEDNIKGVGVHAIVIQPHSQLPKPEAPPGLSHSSSPPIIPEQNGIVLRSKSMPESANGFAMDVPSSIGKFIKERSNSLSLSIAKRLSSLNLKDDDGGYLKWANPNSSDVTEFNISGLKVVVTLKPGDGDEEEEQLKGRISLFSRSNCRDCTAVRTFLRQRGLNFVEINVDVYPTREKELIERTGTSQVPQIFFNEKLFGGLVALNSLRNSGVFDQKLKELLRTKCSGEAPSPPVYGFDDPEEESPDEMVGIVRFLRQRVPIQDRLMKMKIVKNCFAGAAVVEVLIHHLACPRDKAVEICKHLARKHFIHHVFGENDFEDGNHFYRFLEHEPYISKCFNFRGSTNDSEPKPAVVVGQRLYKIMSALLESYASDDRCHVDYAAISSCEEFRRYVNLTQDLQRVDLLDLSADEKLSFFLNLYNAMVNHAIIRVGSPEGVIDRRSFSMDFQYILGGYPYSLNTIKNGILRNNRRSPYSLVKPFSTGDKRLEIAIPKVNPLIHFGLCNGTRSSPAVRFFTPQGVESELRYSAREFFQRGGMEVDLAKRTVHLTRIIKWFDMDFGQEKDMLKWVINYLDASKAGLLTHLLADGGPVNVVYQHYDWSVNS